MSAQVTNEEPILEMDGKKYVISELSDNAKYFVGALNNIQVKMNQLKVEQDTLTLAQEGFTSRLKQEVEKPSEEDSEEDSE